MEHVERRSAWFFVPVVLALACPIAFAKAGQETKQRCRDALYAETVADLEEIALWCQRQRLYAERNRQYETIHRLVPDHRDARRFMKYERNRDGVWEQAESYRAPKNRGEGLEELGRKEAVVMADYRRGLDEWAEEFDVGQGEKFAELLVVAPNDAEARAFRHEVWQALSGPEAPLGRWVLEETVAAQARRTFLTTKIRKLTEARPAMEIGPPDSPNDEESALPLPWKSGLSTKHMRLRSTCSDEPAEEYALCAEAAVELFALVFGQPPILQGGMTVYVIDRETNKQVFLRSQQCLSAVAFEPPRSFWIPHSPTLVIWKESQHDLIDQLASQYFQRMLAESFALEPRSGWALEGMGTLLTVLLTGRHGALLAREASVQGDGAKIWKQAREALASEELDLESVLRKPRGEMSRSDVLVSYAFCRYLIEGHPNDVHTVLCFLGDGDPPETVFEDVLGFDQAELQRRLVRWVQEADGDVWRPQRD